MTKAFEEIKAAHEAGVSYHYLVKFPSECFACGHKFKTPTEVVKVALAGKLACLDCESGALA